MLALTALPGPQYYCVATQLCYARHMILLPLRLLAHLLGPRVMRGVFFIILIAIAVPMLLIILSGGLVLILNSFGLLTPY